jgi:hypothetical protein
VLLLFLDCNIIFVRLRIFVVSICFVSLVWYCSAHDRCLHFASAGRFNELSLRVPEEPAEAPPELGGAILPGEPGRLAREWRKLLAAEGKLGGSWNSSAMEVLVQPNMYGQYVEYGHNGEPRS